MVALFDRWKTWPSRTRIAAFIAGVLVAAALAFVSLAQRDRRVALFAAPLRAEQVTEVVERLAEWNVPFIAVADNVQVDASRRNAVLLKLSLAGVPHTHLASSAEALAKAARQLGGKLLRDVAHPELLGPLDHQLVDFRLRFFRMLD